MKLIILYGPPGVGKLTVAKELEKETGFNLFHNHLVHDLVASVINHELPAFNKQKERLYLEMITLAAEHGTKGLIFTFCYDHPNDDEFIEKIQSCVNDSKGEIHFIQLLCSKETLSKRIKEESRKQYRKVKDEKILNKMFEKYELFTEIPNSNSLSIDSTNLSLEETVKIIKDHFDFKKV